MQSLDIGPWVSHQLGPACLESAAEIYAPLPEEVVPRGDPFQGQRIGCWPTLGNELSKETHVLAKQETLLGRGTQVESSRVRGPGRTALLCSSQARASR